MTPETEGSSASILTIDFRKTPEITQHSTGKLQDKLPAQRKPLSPEGKSLDPKQIRARQRRRGARSLSDVEIQALYRKPIEEWDMDELARGRPRNRAGNFTGVKPSWITAEIHEKAMQKYVAAVKTEMNSMTVSGLEALQGILMNEEVDDKGKYLVPPSVKADVAKFLVEHVIGKPKQHITQDVSVKLQGILATVMGNPGQTFTPDGGYTVGHLPGITMAMAERDDDIIDAEYEEAGY